MAIHVYGRSFLIYLFVLSILNSIIIVRITCTNLWLIIMKANETRNGQKEMIVLLKKYSFGRQILGG